MSDAADVPDDLKNPMRFSFSHRTVGIAGLLGGQRRVTDLEVRPDEGSVLVHWEEVSA